MLPSMRIEHYRAQVDLSRWHDSLQLSPHQGAEEVEFEQAFQAGIDEVLRQQGLPPQAQTSAGLAQAYQVTQALLPPAAGVALAAATSKAWLSEDWVEALTQDWARQPWPSEQSQPLWQGLAASGRELPGALYSLDDGRLAQCDLRDIYLSPSVVQGPPARLWTVLGHEQSHLHHRDSAANLGVVCLQQKLGSQVGPDIALYHRLREFRCDREGADLALKLGFSVPAILATWDDLSPEPEGLHPTPDLRRAHLQHYLTSQVSPP